MYRNSSLMRQVFLIIIVAVSIAASALATDKPVKTAGSEPAPEIGVILGTSYLIIEIADIPI